MHLAVLILLTLDRPGLRLLKVLAFVGCVDELEALRLFLAELLTLAVGCDGRLLVLTDELHFGHGVF